MAQNPNISHLDMAQIINRVYNPIDDNLRVEATISLTGISVEIDQADDSIAIGDGATLYTGTTIGLDHGLDVNVIGGVVSGTFTPTGLSTDISSEEVTISTTPTKIPATTLSNRNGISFKSWNPTDTSVIIYIGDSGVTISNGYPLVNGEAFQADVRDNASVEIYGVVASGTAKIRALQVA